jgi:predicted choloylglycine hydrolase
MIYAGYSKARRCTTMAKFSGYAVIPKDFRFTGMENGINLSGFAIYRTFFTA